MQICVSPAIQNWCALTPNQKPIKRWKEVYLLHELEEDIKQLRNERLHLLQLLGIILVNEVAQGNNSIHPHLHNNRNINETKSTAAKGAKDLIIHKRVLVHGSISVK